MRGPSRGHITSQNIGEFVQSRLHRGLYSHIVAFNEESAPGDVTIEMRTGGPLFLIQVEGEFSDVHSAAILAAAAAYSIGVSLLSDV